MALKPMLNGTMMSTRPVAPRLPRVVLQELPVSIAIPAFLVATLNRLAMLSLAPPRLPMSVPVLLVALRLQIPTPEALPRLRTSLMPVKLLAYVTLGMWFNLAGRALETIVVILLLRWQHPLLLFIPLSPAGLMASRYPLLVPTVYVPPGPGAYMNIGGLPAGWALPPYPLHVPPASRTPPFLAVFPPTAFARQNSIPSVSPSNTAPVTQVDPVAVAVALVPWLTVTAKPVALLPLLMNIPLDP